MRTPRAYYCKQVTNPYAEGDIQGCGEEVPLDHWGPPLPAGVKPSGRPSCPSPPAPLPWLRFILKGVLDDTAHKDLAITATRLTTCPRKVVLEDCVPLVFDPMNYNSISWGRAIHKAMADSTPPGMYSEIHFPLEGKEKPTILGVPMSGTLDFFSPDMVVIEDYKTHSEGAQKFKWGQPFDTDLQVQFSIYKILAEKSGLPVSIKAAAVWHGGMTSANNQAPPWFRATVPFLTEAQIAKVPVGGYTVAQIVKMYQNFIEGYQKLKEKYPTETLEFRAAFDALVKKLLPPVGQQLFGGKMCESYCGAARDYCDGLEGINRRGLRG